MNEGYTVMIVDDCEIIRILARQILESEGFRQIVEVQDGDSALKVLKTQKIDLVISDWNMVGMTGIELLTQMRADRDIAKTPFIMLSVEGLDGSIDEAFKKGANDYVSKPFTHSELASSVARVMKPSA